MTSKGLGEGVKSTAAEDAPGREYWASWRTAESLDPPPPPLFPALPDISDLLRLRYRPPISETDDTVAAFRAAGSPF